MAEKRKKKMKPYVNEKYEKKAKKRKKINKRCNDEQNG